jgi:hypothetical protein
MEVLAVFLVVSALAIGLIALLFGLGWAFSPERLHGLGREIRSPFLRIWHLMALVVVAVLFLKVFAGPGIAPVGLFLMAILAILGLSWFVRVWCDEFVFLMSLADDDLPGHYDKLIWVFLLLSAAPVGVWLFRSFRQARWPEVAKQRTERLEMGFEVPDSI